MTRREWLRLAGAGLVASLAGPAHGQVKRDAAKPNVLFLLADDQRFDTIRALGNTAIETPNLDRLVARGTSFRRACIMGGSDPAVCMPSRAMLLTGRGLFDLVDRGKVIPETDITFPQAFRREGYETFITGKWHQDDASLARSFCSGRSVFMGGMGDHFNPKVLDFEDSGKIDRGAAQVVQGKHSSELFADAAIRFLKERDSTAPFLAYLSFMAPHDPRTAPKAFHERYAPDSIAVPPNFLEEHPFDNGELQIRDELLAARPRTREEIQRHMADYFAMISHLDAQVGRILDALDSSEYGSNTIIVFTADNGLALGQHGLMGKQNLYEHSVRVPLILAGPGIPSGRSADAMCLLSDLHPTLCHLAGVPTASSATGRDLAETVSGASNVGRDTLYFAYRDVQRAVTDGRWKLITYLVKGRHTTQLFDLDTDSWEMNDVSRQPEYADVLRRMETLLRDQGRLWHDHVEFNRADWGLPEGDTMP